MFRWLYLPLVLLTGSEKAEIWGDFVERAKRQGCKTLRAENGVNVIHCSALNSWGYVVEYDYKKYFGPGCRSRKPEDVLEAMHLQIIGVPPPRVSIPNYGVAAHG